MPLDFRILPVTPFQQNCTFIWCDQTRQAAVIDPGGEPERILAAAKQLELKIQQILLTHGHLDHVGASGVLAERLGVPIVGPHPDDAFLIDGLIAQCQMFGFPPTPEFQPTRWLADSDRVTVGEEEFEVIHCPGHTPGHVVFFSVGEQLAQVGDVLFQGSIGRTDFPRGDHQRLLDSIRRRLFPLGDDVRFIPGHGPMSTFGQERRTNPFVRG